jgi:hypothetical protein
MDNLRYLNFGPRPRESDLEDSDTDSIAAAIDNTPTTPTKKRAAPADERTPRLLRRASALTTPRPRPHSASRLDRSGHGDDDGVVVECTLLFLLCVPGLSNLACRVVRAEARRRERTKQSQPHGCDFSRIAGGHWRRRYSCQSGQQLRNVSDWARGLCPLHVLTFVSPK